MTQKRRTSIRLDFFLVLLAFPGFGNGWVFWSLVGLSISGLVLNAGRSF